MNFWVSVNVQLPFLKQLLSCSIQLSAAQIFKRKKACIIEQTCLIICHVSDM